MKCFRIIQKSTQSVIMLGVLAYAAFALVACGSESGTEASDTSVLSEVETSFELGKCRNELNGTSVYVTQEDVNYTCLNGSWNKEESVVTSSFIELFSSSTINEYNEVSQGLGFENNVDSMIYSSSECVLFSSSSLNQLENFSSNTLSSSSNDCVIEVCSLEELPECSVDYKAATVKGIGLLYMCLNGNWKNLGGYYDGGCTIRAKCPESSSSIASSSSVVSNIYDCNVYKCMSTEYLNQDMLAAGKYGELLDVRDSQVYRTIQIGDQVWMAQNLNYDEYGQKNYGSGCLKNSEYCKKYGRVYYWYLTGYDSEYLSEMVCPVGWHMPSKAEFEKLFKTVGGKSMAGLMLKSASDKCGWGVNSGSMLDNCNSLNYCQRMDSYGFSAVRAAYASGDGEYVFSSDGVEDSNTYFWTKTPTSYGFNEATTGQPLPFEAYRISIEKYRIAGENRYEGADFEATSVMGKCDAYSIRCIKD